MHNILIFGDSVSAGKGVKKKKSWPSLLSQYFDNQNRYSILVHNLSFPGESTKEIVKRFSSETKSRTKKGSSLSIIFAIGINDAKCIKKNCIATPQKTFRENILFLIKSASKYANNIMFIEIPMVDEKKTMPLSEFYFSNKKIEKYSAIINKLCIENNIPFIEVKKDFNKSFIAEDGIHLNESGHQIIANKVIGLFREKEKRKKLTNSYEILKKTYLLSKKDIDVIRSNFTNKKIIEFDFFLGQVNNINPEVVIGGPCIRNSTDNVCLNLFSQIFTPIKVASILNKPCKIFIGTKEEILFQPKIAESYCLLENQLAEIIKKISKKLNVKTEIINSSYHCYDKIIIDTVNKLNINISQTKSSSLFSLSQKKSRNKNHSQLRIISSERFIACNTLYALNEFFGKNKALVVADVEQINCFLFAKKYEKKQLSSNFLGFLPLPNILGTGKMFDSKKEEKLILGREEDYYELLFKNSPFWVLESYYKLFELIKEKKNINRNDIKLFIKIIKEINDYIK